MQYVVDPQQRRTARLVNGVVTNRWLYQSQLAIAAEVDSAGTPVRSFTYGMHGNVPTLLTLANGRQFRLVTDHLGSVRLVIDVAADTVVQRLAYDAYGRVIVDTRPGFQPFGYAGGLYDPLTGLVRFGARDYDAEVGRWTGKDPIAFAGGSANLYEYAASSPVAFVDPSGKFIDVFLDLGFVGYDLYRLFTDDPCRFGENLAALGLDVLAAGVPFVTGLGNASRAARMPWGNRSMIEHIFDLKPGHVNPSTAASRQRYGQLFESVASRPANLTPGARNPAQIQAGVDVFQQEFRRGTVWVETKGGIIRNAGVNR